MSFGGEINCLVKICVGNADCMNRFENVASVLNKAIKKKKSYLENNCKKKNGVPAASGVFLCGVCMFSLLMLVSSGFSHNPETYRTDELETVSESEYECV